MYSRVIGYFLTWQFDLSNKSDGNLSEILHLFRVINLRWNPKNETAKATRMIPIPGSIEGVALCWHPDPVPAQIAIDM